MQEFGQARFAAYSGGDDLTFPHKSQLEARQTRTAVLGHLH